MGMLKKRISMTTLLLLKTTLLSSTLLKSLRRMTSMTGKWKTSFLYIWKSLKKKKRKLSPSKIQRVRARTAVERVPSRALKFQSTLMSQQTSWTRARIKS